ncbi:solute carrier family 49 member 4 homolog [Cherax quadricarinatus]|uniref:solute carrier family 49 member 4 homolog n=1 Tax=Cherax quadricarinatus TaxID=27406 RepID=UPI00387E54F9
MTRHDPPAGIMDYNSVHDHKNQSHTYPSQSCGVRDSNEKTPILHTGDKTPLSYGSNGDVNHYDYHTLPYHTASTTITTTTTATRFWILTVFSVLSWVQGVQWNTWGPISESMGAAFPGWGSSTVAMMANWGTIMFVVFVFPMCWATQRYGLRKVVLASTALIFLGTAIRCVTTAGPVFTIMCHLCAILVGVASTVVLAAPIVIASDWFPPHERTTALAVMMGTNQLSGVGSYLEPLLVREPGPDVTVYEIQSDVMMLMYIGAGISVVLLLAVLVYFPSKPAIPPSLTSSTGRLAFQPAFHTLIKNRCWMWLMVTSGVIVGPFVAWGNVLNYSLLPLGLHQDDAMWVGQISVVLSSLSPVASGRFNDLVKGHVRSTLILLMLATTICCYWFLLLSYGVLAPSKWQVYVSVVGGTAFNYATYPLLYEVGVDLAYPAPEILVSGALTAAENLMSTLFLLVFFLPDAGYLWMTYVLVLSTSVTILPLLLIKFSYVRASIDAPYH